MDDDFLGLNNEYGKDGEGYWSLRQKYLKKILQYIDCLLVVNPLLAQSTLNFVIAKDMWLPIRLSREKKLPICNITIMQLVTR